VTVTFVLFALVAGWEQPADSAEIPRRHASGAPSASLAPDCPVSFIEHPLLCVPLTTRGRVTPATHIAAATMRVGPFPYRDAA
jgi:hypothetical protein